MSFDRVYVDASIVCRRTYNQPGALHDVVWTFGVSSELIELESSRSLDNLAIAKRPPASDRARYREVVDRNLRLLHLVPIHDGVLKRAGSSFPTPVGTLDAIHLATALMWAENTSNSLVFLTHDRQLSTAARACGLKVYPDLSGNGLIR